MKTSVFKDPTRLALATRVADVLVLVGAGQLASVMRFGGTTAVSAPIHLILLYFCTLCAFALFPRFGLYAPARARSPLALLTGLSAAWALVLVAGILFSFLMHHVGELSRLWLFDWFVLGLAGLSLVRLAAGAGLRYARRHGLNKTRVLIIGYGEAGREIHRRAMHDARLDYQVTAICDDAAHEGAPELLRVDRIWRRENLPGYIAANPVDEIWIVLPLSEAKQVRQLQHLLRNTLVEIRWIQDLQDLQILNTNMDSFLGFPSIDLNCPASSDWNTMAKYLLDKTFSLAALVLLAPLFLLIAACIKLSSPGPVFFVQPRIGLNGKQFNVFKFRSMNVHQEDGVVTQARKGDARISKVGGFLRRTSLDELPQFLNVLIGDMSVVGPRPHAVQHTQMYRDLLDVYMVRHRAKPGITGWAQINGLRGETDTVDKMVKRVQFDLYYIQHATLAMDLRIVLWTAFKGWTGTHVY
jgi:putative colanic acid biosysnthesis UDP-glucose lipid carrier transferase